MIKLYKVKWVFFYERFDYVLIWFIFWYIYKIDILFFICVFIFVISYDDNYVLYFDLGSCFD